MKLLILWWLLIPVVSFAQTPVVESKAVQGSSAQDPVIIKDKLGQLPEACKSEELKACFAKMTDKCSELFKKCKIGFGVVGAAKPTEASKEEKPKEGN